MVVDSTKVLGRVPQLLERPADGRNLQKHAGGAVLGLFVGGAPWGAREGSQRPENPTPYRGVELNS